MKIITIHDIAIDKYIGYLKMIPAVCAQGESVEDVVAKLKRNYKCYKKRENEK